MTGAHSTGLDEAMVNRIKHVLTETKVEVDKIHVEKPGAESLGGSRTAGSLEALMNRATDRINSALSETSNALIAFVDGLDSAMRAIKDADEQAEVAFNNQMKDAVNLVNKPFFENLMTDDRPDMPNVQLPFFPLSPDTLQEIVSRSEFGQEKEGDR